MKRIDAVQRLELVILILVVAAMSIKPTGDDEATIVVGALILAAAVAVAAGAISRLPAPNSSSVGSSEIAVSMTRRRGT